MLGPLLFTPHTHDGQQDIKRTSIVNYTRRQQRVTICCVQWVNLIKKLINPLRLEQVQLFDLELISKTVVVRTDPIPGAFLFIPRQYYCCGWSERLLLYFVEMFSL